MIKTEQLFDLLLLVAIALLSARLLGYVFHRFKQPAVIGEVLAGVILGGVAIFTFSGNSFTFIDYTFVISKLDYTSYEFEILAQIGILFLLFISGLEIQFTNLKKMSKNSTFVAIGGVIVPLSLGFLTGILFGFNIQQSIVIGLILTATSVGVTVRTLMDIHVLDTDVGATILGGAVIDDILGIVLLAFAIGIDSLIDAVWIGGRIAIFFLVFLYLGLKVIDKVLDLGEKLHLPKAFLSISLAILLLYSFFADKAGISGIIGAFVAGVIIGQNFRSRGITDDVKTIGYGLFIPLFFVWVGSRIWCSVDTIKCSIMDLVILSAAIIFVSIIGKIFGCGLGAKIAGMTNKESLQIGVGMIPRLELALIIASAGISKGILMGDIAHYILLITVIMTIVTTLITPPLIKQLFK